MIQYDCWVNPSGTEILNRLCMGTASGYLPHQWYEFSFASFNRSTQKWEISVRKYMLGMSEKEEQKLSLKIAKYNKDQDPNNKYYANIYEEMKCC